MPQPKRIVRKMELDRVDLVTRGANHDLHSNDGAHILLMKRAPAMSTDTEKVEIDGGMMAKAMAAFMKSLGFEQKPSGDAGDPPIEPVKKTEKTPMADALTMEAVQKMITDATTPLKTSLDTTTAALTKAQTENAELAKRVTDAEKRATDAEKLATDESLVAKAERDARVMAEFVTVAKSFKRLPVDAAVDKDAGLFKRVSEKLEKADADRVMTLLKAADKQLESASLFSTLGSGARPGVNGSAEAEIFAKADELVKADAKLSRGDAIQQVTKADPELRERYRIEKMASIKRAGGDDE
jgi:hypothetical protein